MTPCPFTVIPQTALRAAVTPGGGHPWVRSRGVHTTQAVHPFPFEMVASGVEGEDRGGLWAGGVGEGARHSRNCLVCISSVLKLKYLSVLGTFGSESCFSKT